MERAGHKIKGLSPNLHHITGVGHDPSPAGIITGVKDVMKIRRLLWTLEKFEQ